MKIQGLAIFLSSVVLLNSISKSTTNGSLLHDIKEIVKDIFSSKDGGDEDSKETERVRKTMAEWKSCLGVQLDKSELTHMTEACDEEFEINSDMDKKKKSKIKVSACYRVCELEQLGWLHDADSEHTSGPYFNHTAVNEFVKSTFPESVQKGLKDKISACARQVESFSDEKACKNYKSFFKCLDKAIHDKCKKKRGKGKKGTTEMPTTAGAEDEAETTTEAEITTEAEAEEETTTEHA